MIFSLSQFLDENRFFVVFVVENDHNADVTVRTSISGMLEVDHLKPKEILTKGRKWKTKKSLSISAVDASTNRTVNINGQSIIHLESKTSEYLTLKVLKIEGI